MKITHEHDQYIDLAIKEFKEKNLTRIYWNDVDFMKSYSGDKWYYVWSVLSRSEAFISNQQYFELSEEGLKVKNYYNSWRYYKRVKSFYKNPLFIGIVATVIGGIVLLIIDQIRNPK